MKSNVKKLYRTHRIIFSLGMATALALTAGIAVVSASCSPTPNPDPEPPAPANHKLVMYASSNKLEYDSYNTASTIYATYTDSDQTPSTFTASQNISLKVKNSLVNDKYYIFRDNGDGSGVLTMREGIPSVGSVKHVDIEAEDADGLVSDYIVDLMPNRKNPSPIPTPQISISNDNPTLQYDNEDDRESKVDVSVNTGGVVTLTTSGDGENDYWTFKDNVVKMKREIPYDSSRIIITITASYPGAEDQSTTVTLLPNFSHTIQIDADNHVLSFNDGPKESVIKATCTSGMSPKLKCNLVGNDCFTFEDNKDGTGLLKMIKPVDDGIISVDIVATCHDAVAQSITIILTHDHVENPTVNVSASSYQLSSQNPTSIITAWTSDDGVPTLALDNNAYCSLIDGVLTLNSTPTDYQTVKVTANYTNDIGSAVPQSVNITLIPDSPIPDHYQTTPSKGVLDNLDDVVTLVTTNNGDPVDATYTTTSTDVTIDGNAVKYTNLVDIQQNIVIKATVDGKIVSDTVITLEPATPIPDHYQTTPSKGVLDNLDDVVTLVTTNNGDPVDATYTTTSTDVTIDGNAVKYTNLVDIQQNIVIKATVDGKIVSDTVITLEPATPIPDHYQTTPSKWVLDSLNDVLTLTTTNNGAPVDATYTTTSTDVTINGNSVQYTTRVDTRQTIPVNTIINDKIVADTFITLEAVPVTGFGEIALSNGVRINVRDSTDFNLLCNRNDSDTYITINGISFRKDTLTGFIFGPDFNLDTIGPNFLYRCSSFNQSLTIPPSVVNIGSCFLANCYAFNKPLTIPSTVVSIDSYFLAYCKFNQPLTIPATITSIDYGFLYECHDFDSYIYCPGNASKPTGWANYASSFQGTHLIYKWMDSKVLYNTSPPTID